MDLLLDPEDQSTAATPNDTRMQDSMFSPVKLDDDTPVR